MKIENRINVEEKVLADAKARFLTFDQQSMIDLFDLVHDESTISVWFLGQTYTIDRLTAEVFRASGEAADINEIASIFELLTRSEHVPAPVGQWASISQLCTNTTDTSLTRYIEQLEPFSGHMDLMKEACAKLGGTAMTKGDVSSVMPVFHGIDVWFQYWEADDEFPASVQFLWDLTITDHFRWSLLWNVMSCITRRMKEEIGLI